VAITGDLLSSANEGLKTYFRKKLSRDIPDNVPFFSIVKDKSQQLTFGGRSLQATWAIETQRGWGLGVHGDGGDFTDARPMAFENYVAALAHYHWTTEFTGHLEAAGRSDPFTYLGNIMKKLSMETQKGMTRWLGISSMSDGTAVLGRINGIPAGNVLTLDETQMNYFEVGMYVTVRDTRTGGSEQLTGTLPAGGLITAVDYQNNTITIGDATGAADNDYVALRGLYDQTLMEGIRSLNNNTGTVQGVNRATAGNEWAESWNIDGGTAALSESMVQKANDEILNRSRNKKYPGIILSDTDSRRWFFGAMVDRHRFADNERMVGGYKSIGFHTGDGTRDFVVDPCAYPGEIHFLDLSTWGIAYPEGQTGGGWYQPGKDVLLPKPSAAGTGYADAKVMIWITRCQLICDEFRNNAWVDNYTAPSGYA
jgi:hypothetical protein